MTSAAQQNQHIASEGMSRVTKLLGTPEFHWFMRECVIASQRELDAIIHNRQKSSQERESALDEWIALESTRTWADKQRAAFGKTLGHMPVPPTDFSNNQPTPTP